MNRQIIDNTENQQKRVMLTIVWGGMGSVMGFLVNFLITPLVTKSLGTEAYGFVSLANNFVMYATILTTALNAFATRYISIEYHKNDMKRTMKYFNSVLFSNIVVGSVILTIMLLVIWKLEYLIVIPKKLVLDVKILFIFMFLNFFALLLGNTFLASAYIKNRLDLSGFFKALGYVIEIILIIALFKFLFPKIGFVGIGYFAYSLVILISSIVLYKNLTPEIKIRRREFSFAVAKKLVLDGVWNSINSMGNTLNSGLDLIITNLMLSPLMMGQLSIAKTLGNILCMMYQIVSQAFQPILLKMYAKNDKKRLLNELRLSMKVSGLVSGLFFVGFVVLGKSFLELWIPNQDTEYIYVLTVITLLSFVLEGIVGPLYYIYTLTIKNRIPCIITICFGIINIVAKIALLQYTNLDALGVVISTSVVMIFINLVTNPLYMAHCLEIKWHSFYPPIFRYIVYNAVSIVGLLSFFNNRQITNWGELALSGFFVCIIGGLLYFIIVMNKKEKNRVLSMINRNYS